MYIINYKYTHIYIYIHTCIIYIYVCVCVTMCLYIHTYIYIYPEDYPEDSFSWKMSGVSAFQWFQVQCFMSFHSPTLPRGAGSWRNFAGNFQRFRWQLWLCSTQASNLEQITLHIQLLFQKQGVSGVWRQIHRFQRKAGKHRELRIFSRILNLQICR